MNDDRLQRDYDELDDYWSRDEETSGVLWMIVGVMAIVLGLMLADAVHGQDFSNLAGAKRVGVSGPVSVEVDPVSIMVHQDISFLCGYIAILSSARSDPKSPVYVAGQKAMKCVENTDPVIGPGTITPPNPTPTPTPAFTNARVTYAAGVITVEAASQFVKVEVLIDESIRVGKYLGVKPLVNGKAQFTVPVETRDGLEHLIDTRLYTATSSTPVRPDGYPVKIVLTP